MRRSPPSPLAPVSFSNSQKRTRPQEPPSRSQSRCAARLTLPPFLWRRLRIGLNGPTRGQSHNRLVRPPGRCGSLLWSPARTSFGCPEKNAVVTTARRDDAYLSRRSRQVSKRAPNEAPTARGGLDRQARMPRPLIGASKQEVNLRGRTDGLRRKEKRDCRP